MITPLNDGGPAFPHSNRRISENTFEMLTHGGMSLRDWFAGKVIQGICASGPAGQWTNDRLAAEAYDLADAMLKARQS